MFHLKIFEEVLSHLHGNYKQDIQDEGDPNFREIDHLKRNILAGCTKVNVIPLNPNLSC